MISDETVAEVRAVRKAGEVLRLRAKAEREAMGKALFRHEMDLGDEFPDAPPVSDDKLNAFWSLVLTEEQRIEFCDRAEALYRLLTEARDGVEVELPPDSR